MSDEGLKENLEMFNLFITDSRELLDDVEPKIIEMEEIALTAGKIDEDILNAIFRLFHSLKGSASFLGLQTITTVTHEAETLLDIFRNQKATVSPEQVDLLISTSDFIRKMVDIVEHHLNDEGFECEAAEIIGSLRKTIADIQTEEKGAPGELSGTSGNSGPAGTCKQAPVINSQTDSIYEPESSAGLPDTYTPSENLAEMDLAITPEMIGRFVEEGRELLDEAENTLLALEKTPQDKEYANRAFRALHSFKGNAGFFGCSEIEDLSHHAETLLDKIREDEKTCDPVAVSFLLIAIDALRDGIDQTSAGIEINLPGKKEICQYLKDLAGGGGDDTEDKERTCRQDNGITGSAAKGAAGKDSSLPESAPADTTDEIEDSAQNTASHPPQTPEPKKDSSSPGGPLKTPPDGAPEERDSNGAKQQQAIRVDLDKLDKLLDLVGEMVIAEAMVTNNPDLRGLHLDRFEKAVLQLDKITRDIQEVAMSMRMIPLSGAFRRMMRLVRDLAQKAGKKVSLQIIGEETEVDKTIIEQIADPLVHLIRNAVDHGLESPAERLAAGKPETGRVTIEAKHSVGEVWIIIEDDGRGLDREKILQKGVEKGLIRKEDSDLKDEEVWRMIFEPGFSTAQKVSNVSGRGVGMDVVRRNIEKLRGKVDVRSKPGAGTMFAVRIPLTLAIIEGMVVKVGQNRYTIPINSIKESLKPGDDQITRTPDNLEVVTIRGELLPVIRLHEFYNVEADRHIITEGILIVVENDVNKCCLFVDEVIGQQQIVIKGLSSYLGHVRSVSGCAILGDGDISMILDIDDLINIAEAENS